MYDKQANNWESYLYPDSRVLKNKADIQDWEKLNEFMDTKNEERHFDVFREKYSDEVSIKDLKKIHYLLFQDIFEWAGNERIVKIEKESSFQVPKGTVIKKSIFVETDKIPKYIEAIDTKISNYLRAEVTSASEVCHQLADIFIEVNQLHLFREGNGRSQRLLIQLLANRKGLHLDLEAFKEHKNYRQASAFKEKELLGHIIQKSVKSIHNYPKNPMTKTDKSSQRSLKDVLKKAKHLNTQLTKDGKMDLNKKAFPFSR